MYRLENVRPRDGQFDAAHLEGGFLRRLFGADDEDLPIPGSEHDLPFAQRLLEQGRKLFLYFGRCVDHHVIPLLLERLL